jgi:hypothetical protein
MKTPASVSLLISCVLLTSCATILEGSRQEVSIHSNPAGANIFINGENKGATPRTILMKRKISARTVVLSIDGYENYEVNTKRKLNGYFFGNILLGGVIGMAIDAATGAMYRITPAFIDVDLKKKENK